MKRETNFKDNEYRVVFFNYYLVMEALRITNIKQLDKKLSRWGLNQLKMAKS